MGTVAVRRKYDHRALELVYDSGSMKVAEELGMPRSTARSLWRRGLREVVTLDLVTKREKELLAVSTDARGHNGAPWSGPILLRCRRRAGFVPMPESASWRLPTSV